MHFGTKNILKNNHNHTLKQTTSYSCEFYVNIYIYIYIYVILEGA